MLLLLHDPRCIAEHKPSQQTAVSRFVFLGTHAEASNGTAAAAAAAVAVAAAAAAAQQQKWVQQQGRPKHMYEYTGIYVPGIIYQVRSTTYLGSRLIPGTYVSGT